MSQGTGTIHARLADIESRLIVMRAEMLALLAERSSLHVALAESVYAKQEDACQQR